MEFLCASCFARWRWTIPVVVIATDIVNVYWSFKIGVVISPSSCSRFHIKIYGWVVQLYGTSTGTFNALQRQSPLIPVERRTNHKNLFMFDHIPKSEVKRLTLSVGKLLLFLYCIPCIVTFLHIRHNIYANWNGTILVNVNTASIGAVASGLYGRKRSNSVGPEVVFHKILQIGSRPTGKVFGIYQGDAIDAAQSAAGRNYEYISIRSDEEFPYLTFSPTADQSNGTEPCIYLSKGNKICGNDVIHVHSNTTISTSVDASEDHPTTNRHWMHYIIFQIPATSFWIFVNCCLAFVYWNRRIAPDAVAKIYNRIIPMSPSSTTPEVWRIVTGSTAHFEPLHLGMNMLSLSALGKELEGRHMFTSISFFTYNCSLIVIVAAIWLSLQHLMQIHRPTYFDANGATVGFSGVLFAWMVVASLDQTSTCPLIFAPSVCFPTYELYGPFKFSLSPFIQLVVMQVILPRVSFTGHLSGIIAGYLIHWELLPIRYFQPALIIPIMYLFYLRHIRNVFVANAESGAGSQNTTSRVKTILGYHMIVLFYSVTVLGILSSTTLTFATTTVYWYQLHQSMNQSNDLNGRLLTWSRAYIVAAVLVLISDAMTVGGWAAFSSLKIMPILLMLVRAVTLFLSVVVARMTIAEVDDGIFEWTLSYTTLNPSLEIAHVYALLGGKAAEYSDLPSTFLPETSGNNGTFNGVGHRLGGSNSHKANPWKQDRDIEGRLFTS
jgi:membrane associated rhomboid family serine protease